MAINFGSSIPFTMFLSGGNTPAPNVTPVVQIAKEGGVLITPFGAVNAIGAGLFRIAANVHDTDTPGSLCLSATAPGCDPTLLVYEVRPMVDRLDLSTIEDLLSQIVSQSIKLVKRPY